MSKSTPPTEIRPWLQGLRPGWFHRKEALRPPDPLRSAGQVLREAREAKGLGLRDLAHQTRISIAVLEALEGGWKDRLPEATYLRAMLPLLEQQLDLPAGSLAPVLPHAGLKGKHPGVRAGGQGGPFSPANLALLSSWQSTLAYGLLVLGLLYGVNLQQQRLAAMGRLAANPVPVLTPQSYASETPAEAFPDLHPLAGAAKGQAMELLAQDSKSGGADLSLGLLQINLSQPTRVDLRSQRGGQTQLQGVEGELSLPVVPPFELRLNPAPLAASVRWKGVVIPANAPAAPARSSGERGATAVYGVPLRPEAKPTSTPPKAP